MATIALRPIGKVESRLTDLAEAPRQADEGAPEAWLVIDAEFAAALEGLKAGADVIVITWLERAARHPVQSPARRSVTARGRRLHDPVAAPPQSARAAPGHRRRHRRLARARPEPRSRGWHADPRHQGSFEPGHSRALRRPRGCLFALNQDWQRARGWRGTGAHGRAARGPVEPHGSARAPMGCPATGPAWVPASQA